MKPALSDVEWVELTNFCGLGRRQLLLSTVSRGRAGQLTKPHDSAREIHGERTQLGRVEIGNGPVILRFLDDDRTCHLRVNGAKIGVNAGSTRCDREFLVRV
jgi:hypothetical protein